MFFLDVLYCVLLRFVVARWSTFCYVLLCCFLLSSSASVLSFWSALMTLFVSEYIALCFVAMISCFVFVFCVFSLYYGLLYCVLLWSTVMFCIMFCFVVLCCFVLYCVVFCCVLLGLYSVMFCYIVLCCYVLFCVIFFVGWLCCSLLWCFLFFFLCCDFFGCVLLCCVV